MTKSMTMLLFALMVVAQLAVPVTMIAERELTLRQGTEYRFRCAPVDPYDAFRGKYVAIGIELEGDLTWRGTPLRRNQAVFVALDVDDEGFARATSLTLEPPESGDYIEAKVSWWASVEESVPLTYPFDRYYMEESIAPEAERAYRDATWSEVEQTYITVRVRSGRSVIDELFIGGKPFREYLEAGQPDDIP